jgi:hypothetical protein
MLLMKLSDQKIVKNLFQKTRKLKCVNVKEPKIKRKERALNPYFPCKQPPSGTTSLLCHEDFSEAR